MVELPRDVLELDIGSDTLDHRPVRPTRAAPAAHDVEEAARLLVDASCPVILAGQGVLYAEASDELVKLAELLQSPVMTTVDGKSAFPEDHALALGSGGNGFTGHGAHFLYAQRGPDPGDRHRAEPPSADHAATALGRAHHPRHQRHARSAQELRDRGGVARRCEAGAGGADRCGEGSARRTPAEPLAGGGDRDQARGLAGEVAGEADLGRDADHAVSGDQRIHARGGSGRRDRHA